MDYRQVLQTGTVLDGKYRIERVIGSGGFGITYEAFDLGLAASVAIKEYYPSQFGVRDATYSVRPRSERDREIFDRLLASFIREARTLNQFEHPAIVRVLSVFEGYGTAYMVMKYETGPSLKAWLADLVRLPTQGELDRLTAPLLDALEMMHNAEFLHRDIAPDNIIVRADGSPVLLDFGASRRVMGEMTGTLTGVVKKGYSPQEQYATDSRSQGPWTDIYALGATLYRCISGETPYEATERMLDDHVLPAVEAGAGRYRHAFLVAIDAAMVLRPKQRPQSIAVWREMLFDGVQISPSQPQSWPSAGRAAPAVANATEPGTTHLGSPSAPRSSPRSAPSQRPGGEQIYDGQSEPSAPGYQSAPSDVGHQSAPRRSEPAYSQDAPGSTPQLAGSQSPDASPPRRNVAAIAMVAGAVALIGGGGLVLSLNKGGTRVTPVQTAFEDVTAKSKADEAQRKAAQKSAEDARRRQDEQFERLQRDAAARAAEEARQRQLAEDARQRRIAEEAEAKRRADEEARRLAEEARQRQLAEEARQRRIAEEAEAKRRADEEARRLAEEARQRRIAEEAEAKRLADEEARRLAEETRQRQLAEEARQRRIAEEAEAKRRADEAARKAAEAERIRIAALEQQQREEAARRAAEEERRRLAARPRLLTFSGQGNNATSFPTAVDTSTGLIVAGGSDGVVRVWDAATGTPRNLQGQRHSDTISSVAVAPDGQHIVTGAWGGEIVLWTVNGTAQRFRAADPGDGKSAGRRWVVTTMFTSPTRFMTVLSDGTSQLWDTRNTGRAVAEVRLGANGIKAADIAANGSTIATGTDSGTVTLHRAGNGQVIRQLPGQGDWILALAFSRDNNLLGSGSADGIVRIFSATNANQPLLREIQAHDSAVRAIAFSADGTRMATGADDGTVTLWDVATGAALARYKEHRNSVRSLTLSADGQRLVSASEDGDVRVWYLDTLLHVAAPGGTSTR
jgi:serine/threonine protein kinase